MKHPKKAEGRIGRNVACITMKMKTIVRTFYVIKIIELYLGNLYKQCRIIGKNSENFVGVEHGLSLKLLAPLLIFTSHRLTVLTATFGSSVNVQEASVNA